MIFSYDFSIAHKYFYFSTTRQKLINAVEHYSLSKCFNQEHNISATGEPLPRTGQCLYLVTLANQFWIMSPKCPNVMAVNFSQSRMFDSNVLSVMILIYVAHAKGRIFMLNMKWRKLKGPLIFKMCTSLWNILNNRKQGLTEITK